MSVKNQKQKNVKKYCSFFPLHEIMFTVCFIYLERFVLEVQPTVFVYCYCAVRLILKQTISRNERNDKSFYMFYDLLILVIKF